MPKLPLAELCSWEFSAESEPSAGSQPSSPPMSSAIPGLMGADEESPIAVFRAAS